MDEEKKQAPINIPNLMYLRTLEFGSSATTNSTLI